jgi:hypothetical protein
MDTTLDPRSLRNDDRGAIMVIGVFLSCLILAGMWYVIGLGDAIIWRDRSQEAADAIAFTSASVHARGMNLIAFVNLLMVVIVTIYLLLSLVRAIIDIGLYITGDPSTQGCFFWSLQGSPKITGHSLVNLGAYMAEGVVNIFDENGGPRYDGVGLGGAAEHIGFPLSKIPDNSGGRDAAVCAAEATAKATKCLIAYPLCWLGFFLKCCKGKPFTGPAQALGRVYRLLDDKIIPPYRRFMKTALPIMSEVEYWTARLAPPVGAVAGSVVGAQYAERTSGSDPSQTARHWGTALSASMMEAKSGDQARCKRMRDDLKYIPYQGNGRGPTLCNDGMVSNSGPPGCTEDRPGCICYRHGGVNPDQSGLYRDAPCDNVDDSQDRRVGLPVQGVKMNELCIKTFQFLGDVISGIVSAVSGAVSGRTNGLRSTKGQEVTDSESAKNQQPSTAEEQKAEGQTFGGLFSNFMSWVGEKFKDWYCTGGPSDKGIEVGAGHTHGSPGSYEPKLTNRDFWEKHERRGTGVPFIGGAEVDHYIGPHHMVPYAANGNDWMQVYGFVLDVNKPEFAFDRVAVGQGPKEWNSQQDSYSGAGFYVSEAEFYFDCSKTWTADECNQQDKATYRMSWRTRMRRVHRPKWLKELTDKVPLQGVISWIISNNAVIIELTQRYAGIDINTAMGLLQNFAGGGRIPPNMVH